MVGKSIANNLRDIDERIRAACARVHRSRTEVKLVAVSKGQPVDKLRAAIAAGQRCFGENYLQEASEKISVLEKNLEWHFIGALQSNKAKQVVGSFALIHSVDRDSVLSAIAKSAVAAGVVQDILLEVNLAGESSKAGLARGEVAAFLRKARSLPQVRVRGLMSLPPPGSAEQSRPHFRELHELLCKLRESSTDVDFRELSMGTSQDFEVAVEEGATLVRVGTDIFGSRERGD